MLTSRFISWSRKSSFRPHGSAESDSARQCSRWPRNRTTSSVMSDRPDELRDLLRDERLVGERVRPQLSHPLLQPRAKTPRSRFPTRRARARTGPRAAPPARRDPRGGTPPPACASRRARRARRRPPPRRDRPTARRPRRHPPASPGSPAPAETAADRRASSCRRRAPLARPVERAAQRVEKRLVQLDFQRRHAPLLHADADLDPAARHALLHERRALGPRARPATAACAAADPGIVIHRLHRHR